MIAKFWEYVRDRAIATDPGYTRLRLGLSAVLGILIAIVVLKLVGLPLPIMLVAAIAAMMTAFTVNDPTPQAQAVTLVLGFVAGASLLTIASIGETVPPTDIVLFVLLIFVAVYCQRFGSRGIALGSLSFFMFFFAMFLQIRLHQIPTVLLALAVGIASNALVRFVLLPRRREAEFFRLQKAFRARLGAVIRGAEGFLASNGSERSTKQLRRANARLHEAVLLIDDAVNDVFNGVEADQLRRRSIEVELAVQWLSKTAQRTCASDLGPGVRDELIASLQRFRSLIERDPHEVPLISETGEFSKMLVEGSRLDAHPKAGDELRRAIAELAVADVKAQRVVIHDNLAAPEPEPAPAEKTKVFAYDNQTRSAIQAVIGAGLAVLGGQVVSHQRWYWAVLTVFVVFLGTSSTGARFVKGARRLVGTLIGIFGGVLLTLLVNGSVPAILALLMVSIFGMVYMSRISQVVMAFFATAMLSMLYSLLGTFTFEVLWIRLAETAVGAAAGFLAAVVIVPVRTRAVMVGDIEDVLGDLHDFLDQTSKLLTGAENVNVIELSRELDRTVEKVRATIEPLTHPINVSTARRDYGWYVLTTLETIAYRARHVAARSQPGALSGEDRRLTLFTDRIIANVDVLTYALGSLGTTRHGQLVLDDGTPVSDEVADPQARSVLSSLGQLDNAVIALGRAFDVDAVAPAHVVA
ncbi:MAG: hypothetical protein JWQ81_1055 [Amycolatopsis sp.]|uniref:FUSC family protein n=1 Tax=Amycolatopsis sp. TaxID=37632 RepID=UPI002637D959|nr:FUSC family protein [Amycolatopsis sp.]MCU1680316.1 hypothetical protein [Amycolatopsis sp.]